MNSLRSRGDSAGGVAAPLVVVVPLAAGWSDSWRPAVMAAAVVAKEDDEEEAEAAGCSREWSVAVAVAASRSPRRTDHRSARSPPEEDRHTAGSRWLPLGVSAARTW